MRWVGETLVTKVDPASGLRAAEGERQSSWRIVVVLQLAELGRGSIAGCNAPGSCSPKVDIRAQVEPAVESASSVVSDPTRLARCGFFAVTDRGELWPPNVTTVCVATTSQPATTGLDLLLDGYGWHLYSISVLLFLWRRL